jgi:hypothetical protein
MEIEESLQSLFGYTTCKWISEGVLGMDTIDHYSHVKCMLSEVNANKSMLIVRAHLFWLRSEIVNRMGIKMNEMTITATNPAYVQVERDLTRAWKDHVSCVEICERFMESLHATFYSRVMARLFSRPRLEVEPIPALNRAYSFGQDIQLINVVMDHVLLCAADIDSRALIAEYNEVKIKVRDFWRLVEELKENVRSQAITVIWRELKLKSLILQAKCLKEIDAVTTEPDIVLNLLEIKRLFIQQYH